MKKPGLKKVPSQSLRSEKAKLLKLPNIKVSVAAKK